MASRVIGGDVFDVLPTLKPGSIDCVVTSPPYWQLRSYLGCECGHPRTRHTSACQECGCKQYKDHPLKHLELGSEATPAEFIANQVRAFGLVRTVMADHAVCWINIGDSYSSQGGSGRQGKTGQRAGRRFTLEREGGTTPPEGIPAGNLCLIPQRLAIALQDDGWFVRSVVVWQKPSAMPASLSGWQWRRCRVKVKGNTNHDTGKNANHEKRTLVGFNARYNDPENHAAKWTDCPGCKKCEGPGGYILRKGSWRPTSIYEPILMLAKSANYFADGEPVKTAPKEATVSRDQYTRVLDDPDEQFAVKHDHETFCAGANLRDVWTIAAEPLREKHYAAYPLALVANCLKSSTSAKGYCPECAAPWVRMMTEPSGGSTGNGSWIDHSNDKTTGRIGSNTRVHSGSDAKPYEGGKTIGWRPSCPHADLEPRPGLVLDPFGGSGRTAIAAQQLGLDSISIELNPDYAEMARRLIHNDNPIMGIFNATENT